MQQIEDFGKWNEAMAIKYNPDEYHNSKNFLIRWIERYRARKILKLLDVQKDDKVLDLGCGAGNMLAQINKGDLYGVDISDFLLNLARQRNYQCPATIVKGDVENLPAEISSRKYNKIFCSEVLEHVLNPEKVIDEILKVSDQNAVIVFSVPNEKLINQIKAIFLNLHIFSFFFPKISKHMTDEWHLREADKAFLDKITKEKLLCRKVEGVPFGFMPLHVVAQYSILDK
ncbi:MAG: Methyltransferase type 11 [Candidatus Magasanikbacteria bacterium GW2011_GWC2_40_17]|uniref:Methyltransferase type 11 n=1 Tax=Candidatus Magasanikbacteria bacterium GW2011_GWA2_42_32 TaxID=1619039 RepID=A0A0G1A8Z0_9BACT|nr:MAG: Methyltransferase type 11 [Candidatus Magasanikbacteria bacterium GW2011_GWC2_40_17]KKS57404.1 MAG: Methyltransferase type 11 [Candidatus Magasanikbacteria bacterium GW2011_GWA2_42_32]